MKSARSRRVIPQVALLETRRLLSGGPTGTWIGQDGHDYVGRSSTPGPDQIQDIHIAISSLPTNLSVTKADIRPWGGGEWMYNGSSGAWAAAFIQTPGSSTADLYVDPYMTETGRAFWIGLTYSDGTTTSFSVAGGTANPNLRMPGQNVTAQWVGQDGKDLTSTGPDVGPDGFQDVHLTLAQLSSTTAVQSVTVTGGPGDTWQSGVNQQLDMTAELFTKPGDSTQADLYFSPDRNLNGQTLTISVVYANGTTDQTTLVAASTDPTLAMPAPAAVSVGWNTVAASWIGQDGQNLFGLGNVHVAVTGLPSARSIVSATLSDEAGGSWVYHASGGGSAMALARSTSDPTKADLDFPPIRDESNSNLTLVLTLDDGTVLATRFGGGPADLSLRAPKPSATSAVAHPGDDLNALANQYGSVHLSAGTYNLSQPLVLNNPVTITADPGTTLLFSQPANAPTWTAAIKIQSGNTTLDGFAVRFAGPINWTANISYGPAVIGTTDNFDNGPGGLKVGLTISHLDLQSPPAASSWEAAPSLLRLVGAQSGTIVGNVLRGGSTEFFGGPWTIENNDYQGTVPNTYSFSVITGHYTHDLLVAGNTAEPVGTSGKTWRFLVLTQSGLNDVVQNNTVVGIGPLDTDTMPNPNATELFLTEAYRLHFEGMPVSVSADGWVVQIPTPQGGAAGTGDVLSILTGPQAGQWRMIAQQINPTTYLLDAPLTPGSFAISISTGFVNTSFQGNTIDARGSSTAQDISLVGSLFGVQVLNNTVLGGDRGLRVEAAPTEAPEFWGWSHAPVLGLVVSGNTFLDTRLGTTFDVDHSSAVKANQGRVYFSATLSANTYGWSGAFLAALAQAAKPTTPRAITLGDSGSLDPGEMVVAAQGNEVQVPAGTSTAAMLNVPSATVNGQSMLSQSLGLPSPLPAPATLALVVDSGSSATDGLTNDGRLRFAPVAGAVGYVYHLNSLAAPGLPVGSPSGFLPLGLQQGANTVFVQAIDASGRPGQAASITFMYVTVPPPPVTNLGLAANGQVRFVGLSGETYQVLYGKSTSWTSIGSATGFVPQNLGSGPSVVAVRAVDPAGNAGPAATLVINPPALPPGTPPSTNSPSLGGFASSTPAPAASQTIAPVPAPTSTDSSATPATVRGPGWKRHPHPFRMARQSASAGVAHPTQAAHRLSHPG